MQSVLTALFLAGVALVLPRVTEGECARCHGAGRVACPKHAAIDCALESNAVFCTFYRGCTSCAGSGTIDCAICVPEPVEEVDEAAAALEKVRDAAVARFLEYEKALGRPLLGGASAHFNLVCELEPMKAEKRRRSRHDLLHLYLDRLEAVHAAYLALFQLPEEAITVRSEFFLWTKAEDHKKAGESFCSYTPVDPAYRRGVDAITSIHFDGRKMEDDEALHRNVVHHAVHGIMNAQEPVGYTGKLHMGWADEGFSLWFEDRLLGAATGFCFYPEDEAGLRGGKWRPTLKNLIDAGEPQDFEAFLAQDSVDMTREQHALGFALVDYFAAGGPARLDRLLQRLRARTPARDAFKEIYGQSLDEVETAWRAWVAKTYAKR